VVGGIAGISFALLLIVLFKGRTKEFDPPPQENPVPDAWDDEIAAGE